MLKRLFGRRQKTNTASIAKERLQIIVAHERVRNKDAGPDFMQDLQRDILDVVRKYLPIDGEQLKVAMERDGECDVLELNIVLSDRTEKKHEDDIVEAMDGAQVNVVEKKEESSADSISPVSLKIETSSKINK